MVGDRSIMGLDCDANDVSLRIFIFRVVTQRGGHYHNELNLFIYPSWNVSMLYKVCRRIDSSDSHHLTADGTGICQAKSTS